MDLEVLSVPAIQKLWVQQMDLCTGKIKDTLIAHPAQLTGKSTAAVSYTHLDVYKRQFIKSLILAQDERWRRA